MRVVMFYHSILSDWNHGNAHFLRGVATELMFRGHDVLICERRDSWSVTNLLVEQGEAALESYRGKYPEFKIVRYELDGLNLNEVLSCADVVLVHEWNDPMLVARIGAHREAYDHYGLFFHDTHHRSVTDFESMAQYDLRNYDGVLVYGAALRDVYLKTGLAKDVWVWHEAADTRVFCPQYRSNSHVPAYEGDLVWIGNWGDDERASEIREFLIEPTVRLGLKTRVYGVRYPKSALEALGKAGIEYAGWLPNFKVPEVFSRFRVAVHIPRRAYVDTLHGIPTIRPFEAMACGIPLVCSPWSDSEGLFSPGQDYLVARDGREMTQHLQCILQSPQYGEQLSQHGLETIQRRHTCAHRVDELLAICYRLQSAALGVPQ